jgi:hypothetical protein
MEMKITLSRKRMARKEVRNRVLAIIKVGKPDFHSNERAE